MLPIPRSAIGAYRIAEWVETGLLLGGFDGPLSKATLRDVLEENLEAAALARYDSGAGGSDFDLESGEDDALEQFRERESEGTAPADMLADDAFEALMTFAEVAGNGYPLDVSARTVRVAGEPAAWPVYRFLLALAARYEHGLALQPHRPSRLFERMSACAWAAYLPGSAAHFGWPRNELAVGQRSFRQALPTVINQARERLTTQPRNLPSRLKDMECDVIAWRTPGRTEVRRGQDVVLAQCAIASGWNSKHVNIDRWRQHVTFAVVPRKGASFPFIPQVMLDPRLTTEQQDAEAEDLGAAVGLWLDRLRLAQLLGADGQTVGLDSTTLQAIQAWTSLVVAVALGQPIPADGTRYTELAKTPFDSVDLDRHFIDLDVFDDKA